MKKSKVFIEKSKLVNKANLYDPKEAFSLLKEVAYGKFDESIEVHYKLGIDPRHADQQLRGTFSLPKGTGKDVRVLAIAEGVSADEAKEAGADYVGVAEYLEKIESGWFDFDVLVTTPDMMRHLGKLGRALGSKGLMPNPKTGTVSANLKKTVSEFKSGKFEYRNDKNGILHLVLGKKSFSLEDLLANFKALNEFILKIKPAKAKGIYVQSIAICATQSQSINIEPMSLKWKGN
jgi:large subunit ribosomal protein L1